MDNRSHRRKGSVASSGSKSSAVANDALRNVSTVIGPSASSEISIVRMVFRVSVIGLGFWFRVVKKLSHRSIIRFCAAFLSVSGILRLSFGQKGAGLLALITLKPQTALSE